MVGVGWNGGVGRRFKTEEIHVYLWLIHVVAQKNKHNIVIILQLKINF